MTTGLAAVGRLALSSYLLRSVIFTTLACGYGLGLYGTISHSQALTLVSVVFALQVAVAVAYARRYALGPFEWVCRALTYGRRPT